MIQKTDLRIGNHLEYFIGEENIGWYPCEIDTQDFLWCEDKNEDFNKVHRGIDITKQILVMSGFIEDENGNYWIDLETHYLEFIPATNGFYPIIAQKPEISSETEQRVGLDKIRYVHELENLFFVLAGVEIGINLETVGK